MNEGIGYSTEIPFASHDLDPNSPAAPLTYASVGLMVGLPNPGMGFPAGLRFTPYAVLENTTAQPLTVTPTLNYMSGGTPRSLALPVLRLKPQETRQLDLPAMLAPLGLGNLNGDINLSFSLTGHGGDLMMATGSVDQTGNFVFPVPPEAIGRSFGKGLGHWTVVNGTDTMYSLWNPTNTDQDFVVTLHYGDGSGQYVLPLHLAAQASTTTDIAMLIDMRQPDANGNLIPNYVQEGSAVISNPKGRAQWMTVAVCGAFYNPRKATCAPVCTYCYGYCDFEVEADPFSVAVNGKVQLNAQATYGDGSVDNFTSSSSWSSNNTSVATVGASTGLVSGVSPGSPTITAVFPSLVEYYGNLCAYGEPIPCPEGSPDPSSSGSVPSQVPTSLSIVPGTSLTTSEAACTTSGGLSGCGVTRTFMYQVNDQNGQPIKVANMAVGDVICSTSTNQLNLQGYKTTCGGVTGSCSGTSGPCGAYTNSNGQFSETLAVCAPACTSSGTCCAAGQTIANQTWTVAGTTLNSERQEYHVSV